MSGGSNRLAGQRAKSIRARALFFTTADDAVRERCIRLMAEAASIGFSEADVTQNEDVPDRVRDYLRGNSPAAVNPSPEPVEELVAAL